MLRLVYNHFPIGFKSDSGPTNATTQLLTDHCVRLTLRRPSHFHWSPGQTAYLILPTVSSLPFEAHPFTIASFDSSLLADTKNTDTALGESARYSKELVFLINVRGGFTKRLRRIAAENGTVKVLVDGPYGSAPDLRGYDTLVLIAGRKPYHDQLACADSGYIRIRWIRCFLHFTCSIGHYRVCRITRFILRD